MALTPPALVAGPPRTSLPHGLFSVLPFREGSTDRWQNGVLFEALGCNPETVKGIAAPCAPENETPSAEDVAENFPKTFEDGGLEQATATPFHIYETYTCSPIGNTLEHAEEVARARLANSEERLVERSLADGLFGAHPSINSDVADVEDLGHFSSAALAVGQLEQALAENYGGVGILHVSRSTAVVLLEDGVIRNRNGRLQTDLGTPVVAGSGYAFEGIIATPAMFGYRSEVFTSSNRPGDLLDRDTNDLYAVAERNYLIGIDPCGIWKATFAAGGSGGGGTVDWDDVQNKPEYLGEDGLEFESLSVSGFRAAAGFDHVAMGGPYSSQGVTVQRSHSTGNYSAMILGHTFTSEEVGPDVYELTGTHVDLAVNSLKASIDSSTVGGQTLESRLNDIESRLEALEAQQDPEP